MPHAREALVGERGGEMAKSSINFQKYKRGGFAHNDRTFKPDYLIDESSRNVFDRSAKEAERYAGDLLEEARENYQATYGQRLQASSYLHEAVINFNEEHDFDDLQRAVKVIEKDTGFRCVQLAMHNDEGHINERGVKQYNRHAHAVFFTLDKDTGKQLYRRDISPSTLAKLKADLLKERPELEGDKKGFSKALKALKQERHGKELCNPARMSHFQDLIAETMKMERGKGGRKGMKHREFKQHAQEIERKDEQIERLTGKVQQLEAENAELKMQAKSKMLMARVRHDVKNKQLGQLEAENAELRSQVAKVKDVAAQYAEERDALKASGEATQADYQTLKREYDALKEQAKAKDLTIGQLRDYNGQWQQHAAQQDEKIKALELRPTPEMYAQSETKRKKAERDAEAAREREKATQAKNDALKAELEAVQQQLADARAKHAELEKQLRQAQVHLAKAQNPMQQRQRQRKLLYVAENEEILGRIIRTLVEKQQEFETKIVVLDEGRLIAKPISNAAIIDADAKDGTPQRVESVDVKRVQLDEMIRDVEVPDDDPFMASRTDDIEADPDVDYDYGMTPQP